MRAGRHTTQCGRNESQCNHSTNTKHQAFFLFTHSEGTTRPSSTKRGYIISHSDLSKSAAKSDPPRGVGATRARSASIFVFLDFLRGALVSVVFCRRGFIDEDTCEWDHRADEMSARDLRPSRMESVVNARELEAYAVNIT
jgi:hypothetical protein